VVGLGVLVGLGASLTLAFTLSRIYQSRALISWKEAVNRSGIFGPQELGGRPEINWLEARLAILFSSHTLLVRMIHDYDLYPGEREALSQEQLLDRMRRAITYEMLGGSSFSIAFDYKDPAKAQQVTARLVDEFVRQNVGEKLDAALATREFMEGEARKVKQQLDIIDTSIARFVSEHPEFETDPTTGLLRGRIGRAAGPAAPPIRADTPELRRALREKGRLQGQLHLLASPRADTQLTQARQELLVAERAYAAKRRKYTELHPDVQRARDYLAQTRAAVATLLAAQRSGAGAGERVRAQLAEVDRTIESLVRQQRARAETAAPRARRPEAGLSQSARLEKRWFELTRDRAVEKAKYDQVHERLTGARVSADLEKQRALSQFQVVDPPSLPRRPIRPSRTKLVASGTAAGALLGFALATLLVLLDPRIYSEEDLRRVSDLPVLAQIPREA